VNADELRILGDRMDVVDLELFEAVRVGNRSARIVALEESAQLWRAYGRLLEPEVRRRRQVPFTQQEVLATPRPVLGERPADSNRPAPVRVAPVGRPLQ